jgi:hypothetical protein
VYRLSHQTLILEPGAGTLVQACHDFGRSTARQAPTQHVHKQLMIAIPLACAIKRDDEQIRTFKFVEQYLTIGLMRIRMLTEQHRITERGTHPVENTGLEQEGQQMAWQVIDHFFGQIVDHKLFDRAPGQALEALGFSSPRRRGLLTAVFASLALLAYFPLFALVSGQPLALRDGWQWIALGVLLQGGIAEELV